MSSLWQFVTKRGSTYVEEFLLLGGDFLCFGVVELLDCIYVLHSVFTFLAQVVFLFLIGLSMIGGDTLMIYVSCFMLFIYLYL